MPFGIFFVLQGLQLHLPEGVEIGWHGHDENKTYIQND